MLTPKPPSKGIDSAHVCNAIRAAFADKPHTPIRIRSTIDQTPLRALACDLIRAHGLDSPKQPAVFPDARVLVARLSDLSNSDAILSIQATFQQLTRWTLQVSLFDPDAGPTTAPLPDSSSLLFDPAAPIDSDAGKPS